MKKIFYALFLLTFINDLSAQSPGGVVAPVLWLKANAGAGTPGAWSDNSGSGNSFSQATSSKWPVLNPNVFNFHEGLAFDGTKFLTQPIPSGFPTANNDRTIFVVANADALSTTGYRWILSYGSPGTLSATFQTGNFDGSFINAFYGPEASINTSFYWNLAPNANGALAAFRMASSTENQYDRGLSITSATPTTAGLSATSANAVVGAIDGSGNEPWIGSIAEIILYNSALSAADRNKVESYLALKYGFTLGTTAFPLDYTSSAGTVFWTGSTTFQNDVFGIGADNTVSALVQQQSNSMNTGNGNGTGQSAKGNIVLSTATALTDDQFLMIGNDAGSFFDHTIIAGEAPVLAEGSIRTERNWKVQNTGNVGPVNLSFDLSGFSFVGGTDPSKYRLMIDEDGDGNYFTGVQDFPTPTSIIGNIMQFTGVNLPANAVFTLITNVSNATLPVTFQGFTATVQQNKATLTWKTSDEINVDHYTAEYSTNGINFIAAGTVPAKNVAGINTYTLTQDNLPSGIRYYRIKSVDKDGKFEYSETKSIKVNGIATLVLKANPIIKDRLELNIDVPQNQSAVIRIVNLSGKILLQQNNGLSTGSNSVTSNLSHIAAGTYLLQVQLANETITKKFVKL